MAQLRVIVAIVCLIGLAAAEPRKVSSYIQPAEHRNSIRSLQDQAAAIGYDLQVVPSDQDGQVAEFDPANVSLLGLIWDNLPSPITAVTSVGKAIISKVWAIAKFLIPIDLVLLGMGLVVGFCTFTTHCDLIINDPLASKITAFKENIPYINELEFYVNEAIQKVHELQG